MALPGHLQKLATWPRGSIPLYISLRYQAAILLILASSKPTQKYHLHDDPHTTHIDKRNHKNFHFLHQMLKNCIAVDKSGGFIWSLETWYVQHLMFVIYEKRRMQFWGEDSAESGQKEFVCIITRECWPIWGQYFTDWPIRGQYHTDWPISVPRLSQ